VTLVTGVHPTVIGKPEPGIFETALSMMPAEGDVVVIGDRLDTDILAGHRLGATTVLVLTGVSTRGDVSAFPVQPDYIFEDLPDLVAQWS
jgi:ribonucleotide monophosphatase NagD (HAD superfamily)